MTDIDKFLAVLAVFTDFTRLSEARVSTMIFGSGNAISRVRAGKDIGVRRVNRAIAAFSSRWPAGAVWPDAVPRPAPETHSASDQSEASTEDSEASENRSENAENRSEATP